MLAEILRLDELEPWQVPSRPAWVEVYNSLDWYFWSTPLAVPFMWLQNRGRDGGTEHVLLSRAFEQVVALGIWQLEHDGQYPESLDALVPGLLSKLPVDPYSGQPFRYRRSQGQSLPPLGLSGQLVSGGNWKSMVEPTRPGQWLLYSLGPNEVDNGAQFDYQTDYARGDFIFPLPQDEE